MTISTKSETEMTEHKRHDVIHKTLFQTLFPYAIQAMYPALYDRLDFTQIQFLKEEFQIPSNSNYFSRDTRFIDVLAEVPLKQALKTKLTIELGEDQKEKISEQVLENEFKNLLRQQRSKNRNKKEQLFFEESYDQTDVLSRKILIHIELERTSNLIEMSQRMREYFNIVSQQFAWTTVIPFVVFFENSHPSGLRWVTLKNKPFDQEIHQFRFISWGLSKDDPLYWLHQNNPLAIPLVAFMDKHKLDPLELKISTYKAIYENSNLSEIQKANAIDHINAYQELDKMSQILFQNRMFTYQNPSDIEMSVTQKLVYEAQQKAKLEGKLKAKQEMIMTLLNLFHIDYTQEQEQQIYSIHIETQLDEILQAIATQKQDWVLLINS